MASRTSGIDGGFVKKEQDLWDIAGTQLETPAEVERSIGGETSSEVGAEASAEASVFVAKGGGKISGKTGSTVSTVERRKFVPVTSWKITRELKRSCIPVIIDDFHYIPRSQQGAITRSLKPLVFDGLPVVYLAIPHRRYDAVKVEREMNGRIELVEVPSWTEDELVQIAQLGFPLLNIRPHFDTSSKLAKEAQGSPHLMQEFCREICYQSGVKETSIRPRYVDPEFDYTIIFERVAKVLGKNIYEKLAHGPRSRAVRLPRQLKNGKTADIYNVVLLALADLKPGVATIEYEEIRSSMKNVLDEELPGAHEVSRVLEQMAKISAMFCARNRLRKRRAKAAYHRSLFCVFPQVGKRRDGLNRDPWRKNADFLVDETITKWHNGCRNGN